MIFHIDIDELFHLWAYYEHKDYLKKLDDLISYYNIKYDIKSYSFNMSCSSSDGFRRKLFPEYKIHRKPPTYINLLKEMRNVVPKHFELNYIESLEADDLIGMSVTKKSNVKNVAVTKDKDIKTIPCDYFNPKTESFGNSSKKEASLFYWSQVLSGDSADGYKGLPKIGMKTANTLLKNIDVDKYGEFVYELYKKNKQSDEYFETQAICAKILTYDMYNFESKTITYNFPHKQMNIKL